VFKVDFIMYPKGRSHRKGRSRHNRPPFVLSSIALKFSDARKIPLRVELRQLWETLRNSNTPFNGEEKKAISDVGEALIGMNPKRPTEKMLMTLQDIRKQHGIRPQS
jgi:hypothetical protein